MYSTYSDDNIQNFTIVYSSSELALKYTKRNTVVKIDVFVMN